MTGTYLCPSCNRRVAYKKILVHIEKFCEKIKPEHRAVIAHTVRMKLDSMRTTRPDVMEVEGYRK